MKNLLLAGACALAAVSLSACGTIGQGPSNLAPVIDAMAHAGCKGNLHFGIGAGSAAGLSPGAFHAENTFDGSCDPAAAPQLTAAQLQGIVDAAVAKVTAPATPSPPPK